MKNALHFLRISLSDKQSRLNMILVVATLAGLALLSGGKSESKSPAENAAVESDTLIPEGSVLVPLDLQNRDALNDLVGSFAIVDLFTVSMDGKQKGEKVGRRVKLIRTPQNPSQFSALVPEDEAPLLFARPGPLFAVIQSRQAGRRSSSLIRKSTLKSRIHIFHPGGGR